MFKPLLIGSFIIAGILLSVYLAYTLFRDYLLPITTEAVGSILGKESFKPRMVTDVRYDAASGLTYPHTNYHPAEHKLQIEYLCPRALKTEHVKMSVTREIFDRLNVGDSVRVGLKISGWRQKVTFTELL